MKKVILFLFACLTVFGIHSFALADEIDTTPPVGTIQINGGALYTNDPNVTLTLSATDDISGVAEMKFANDTDAYGAYEAYSTTKSWTLSSTGDGLKTVGVIFKDNVGNENPSGNSATITLDTVAPVISLVGSSTVNISVGSTYSDEGATALDNGTDDITSSITTLSTVNTSVAGNYTVTYNVTDNAGNQATTVVRNVTVENATTETVLIRNGSTVIFQGTVALPDAGTVEIPDNDGITHTVDADSVLALIYGISQSSSSFTISNLEYYSAFNAFYLKCITPTGGSEACDNWQYMVNDSTPFVGMDSNILTGGESIGLYFGNPHEVVLSKITVNPSESFTATAKQYHFQDNTWQTLTGVTIGVTQPNESDPWNPTVITSALVDSNGLATFSLTNPGTYYIGISEDYYNPTSELTVIDNTKESLLIRNGDTVIFQGIVDFPTSGTVSITDDLGATHDVDAQSVLGFLYGLTQSGSPAFTLSDLQYFDSFGSFYLKCLTPTGGSELCDNWQYVVNGTTPWSSMDATILSGGETVGIYFGSPHRVTFNTTSINSSGSFTATAQKYNYLDNTWSALTGVTIGATQPNESDPWNPTVVASEAVNSNGEATITLSTVGTYDVGISEDFYFPSYPVVVSSSSSGGGGGSGGSTFSIPSAISYLTSVQGTNGSFGGASLYSDWVAMALGASNTTGNIRTKLLEYFTANNSVSSFLTDNERHSMALLALGQNPYSFSGSDFVTPIIDSFDGTQFGDTNLVNDDIFALIVLGKAGYSESDEIISKDIAFIISKQQSDGSWEGSVDMASAGIQALSQFTSVSGVNASISSASTYLQNNQQSNGGWGNISSSAWATGAMNAIGMNWTKDGKSTSDYFANLQATDGGTNPTSDSLQNRIWTTSYAIPAVLGTPWKNIMQSVPKKYVSSGGTSSDDGNDTKKEKKDETTEKEKVDETLNNDEENKDTEENIDEVFKTEIATVTSLPVRKVSNIITQNTNSDNLENNESSDLVANALGATSGQKNKNTLPVMFAFGSGSLALFVVARRLFW